MSRSGKNGNKSGSKFSGLTAEDISSASTIVAELIVEFSDGVLEGVDLNVLQQDIAYQGMDAKRVAAYIMKVAKSKNADWRADVVTMVAILCERGSRLDRIQEKSTNEGKARIDELVARYQLSHSARGPDSITLSRVGASFPQITCEYMKHCINPTVPFSSLDDGPEMKYPREMMCGAFGSLIPNLIAESEKKLIIQCYAYHQVKFSKVINIKNSEKSGQTMNQWKEEVAGYISAAMSADFLPDSVRFACLSRMGFISARGEVISPAIRHFAAKYNAM